LVKNCRMNFYIETNRFILREFRKTDVDDLFEMDSDPEVHTYLGNDPVKSKEEVETYIDAVIQQYKLPAILASSELVDRRDARRLNA